MTTNTAPATTAINPVMAINAARTNVKALVDAEFDALLASFQKPATVGSYKFPTPSDLADKANKNGANLTERGAELLYRLFDDGAGYNRASKALGISQGAAKNRKAKWIAEGGLKRTPRKLDID